MSKGFLSALAGVGFTLLGWYGPWEWPSWPGIVVFDALVAPTGALAEGPMLVRGSIVFLLIAVNVAAWALLCRAGLSLAARRR